MTVIPNVIVVLSRCAKNKAATVFGLRIEERPPGEWAVTWGFPVSADQAKQEGYGDRARAHGTFRVDDEYQGCPGCAAASFVQCGCQRLGCWDGVATQYSCPWCGQTGPIGGRISSIQGGGDT